MPDKARAAAGAADLTAEDLAHAGVYLDEEERARDVEEERRRWNTIVYPKLRCIGFQLLALVVVLLDAVVLAEPDWGDVVLFVAAAELYCLGSWLALRRWYGSAPRGRPDLGDLFFATDLVLWAAAIYVTGAERSWLFLILAFRAADQAYSGPRRALIFAHLGVLAYAGMLAWVALVDGRSLPWTTEAVKLLLLWAGGLYLAMSAAPAQRRRAQGALAIRFSRGLIRRLEARSRDLAEQTRRADALRRQSEETSGARTRRLSEISHEFRTPLNHILGFAQLLDLDPLTEHQRENVAAITEAGRRLLRLSDQILEITGVEPGEQEVRMEPVAVRPVLDTALLQLRPWIEERRLAVEVDGSGAGLEAPWVLASPRRLEQILWNLLSSAVHHARRGGSLRVGYRHEEGFVRVEVVDPRRVIGEEEMRRLFEPLGRMTDGEVTEDRGLELAVAQALVGTIGGRIDMDSGSGTGTVLWVELVTADRPIARGGRPATR